MDYNFSVERPQGQVNSSLRGKDLDVVVDENRIQNEWALGSRSN